MTLRIGIKFLCLLLLSSFLFSTNAFAAPWQFEIAPYIWGMNMRGRTSIGPATFDVNQSFTDLLKHLDVAAMLYATAHKDQLGFYFNGMYSSLSDNGHFYDVKVHADNQFGVFGGGISYIAFQRQLSNERAVSLEPYAGVRYTLNNSTLKLNNSSFSKNVNWTDPVIGLRFDYAFNKKWTALLIGDIGGTNASTHYSYSAGAFLGYQSLSWQHVKLYLGYRILGQHYQTGSGRSFYDWDMKLYGPLLGIGFIF
ncbi:MAG: hypothetical protein SFW66_01910 [Gammaproteobacteria bacterium]|nr:hypothetical protein [Gammaproteobacteria bacterium]